MYRAHALQREPVAGEFRDDSLDRSALAADDAFVGAVDDEQVDALPAADRGRKRFLRAVDHAADPLGLLALGKIPASPQHFRFAREIVREQGRAHESLQHGVALAPGAHGEERGGFAQAVADRRGRPDAEAQGEIGHHGAERQLAANQGAMVGEQFRAQGAVPEPVHAHLAREPLVLRVLRLQDLRPLACQGQAHILELVARSRKYESDPPRVPRCALPLGKHAIPVLAVARRFVFVPSRGQQRQARQLRRIAREQRDAVRPGLGTGMRPPPLPGDLRDRRVAAGARELIEFVHGRAQRFGTGRGQEEQGFRTRAG